MSCNPDSNGRSRDFYSWTEGLSFKCKMQFWYSLSWAEWIICKVFSGRISSRRMFLPPSASPIYHIWNAAVFHFCKFMAWAGLCQISNVILWTFYFLSFALFCVSCSVLYINWPSFKMTTRTSCLVFRFYSCSIPFPLCLSTQEIFYKIGWNGKLKMCGCLLYNKPNFSLNPLLSIKYKFWKFTYFSLFARISWNNFTVLFQNT